jgi:hypothetical protein
VAAPLLFSSAQELHLFVVVVIFGAASAFAFVLPVVAESLVLACLYRPRTFFARQRRGITLCGLFGYVLAPGPCDPM